MWNEEMAAYVKLITHFLSTENVKYLYVWIKQWICGLIFESEISQVRRRSNNNYTAEFGVLQTQRLIFFIWVYNIPDNFQV
jgi:hypothetical protein